jgi:hypothetical protein
VGRVPGAGRKVNSNLNYSDNDKIKRDLNCSDNPADPAYSHRAPFAPPCPRSGGGLVRQLDASERVLDSG